MNWIVTWIVVTYFMVPCPQSWPVVDEFGREGQGYQTTLQCCYDSKEVKNSRVFKTHEDAEAFYRKILAEIGNQGDFINTSMSHGFIKDPEIRKVTG